MPINDEPFSITKLVQMASQKYEIPISQCWEQTVADLFLMVSKAEESDDGMTNNATLFHLACVRLDERIALHRQLTPEQRIELHRLKQECCSAT